MKMFPIVLSHRVNNKIYEIRGLSCPFLVISIPWEMIAPHEKQAEANHEQTLNRLAERGGLSAAEVLAVLSDKKFTLIPFAEANNRLCAAVLDYQGLIPSIGTP